MLFRPRIYFGLLLLLLAASTPAFAQEEPAQAEPNQRGDVRVTKAPKLISEVQAEYTDRAIESRIEGRVVLQIQIDAEGKVTRVEVLEGVGYGLDEAAADAARRFVFEPAEINGQPAAVVLSFSVNFTLPILPADFIGRIVDPDTEAGIEGAAVTIIYTGDEYEEPPQATTFTDDEGAFWFGDVPAGPYQVILEIDEYQGFETDIDLVAGEVVEVSYSVSAAPDNLRGAVRESGTRTPLAGIEVRLVDIETEELLRTDFTDGEGAFAFRGLAPGTYLLQLTGDSYLSTAFDVEIVAGELTTGTYYIQAESYDEYTIRTTARRPQSEISRQTIGLDEVRRMPGTGGDVVRVVQNMPGVARAQFISGLIVVRGSAPQDTKTFLEGDSIPIVYHFFGGPAIVNTEMIEAIDFYPGNFSVAYGRATGGIIDLRTRSPRSDRLHGTLEVDLLDSSAIIEGPITENLSIALSARRSYYDVFLPTILERTNSPITVLPRYYDYQGWITYRGLRDHIVEGFIYGSDDSLDVILPAGEPAGDANVQITDANLRNSFHRGQIRWEWRPENLPIENLLMASYGVNSVSFEAAENLFFDADYYQSQIREELRIEFHESFRLRTGADFLLGNTNYKYSFPSFDQNQETTGGQGEGRPNFDADGLTGDRSAPELNPAFFTEAEIIPFAPLTLIPGIRVDFFGAVNETSVSPRFSTRYRLPRAITLKGGVGLFTQPPQPGLTEEDFGNPNLTFEKSIHYAIGADWRPTNFLEIDSTLFYRDMYDLVTQTNDTSIDADTGQVNREIFNNKGLGRAYGLEFLLRHYPQNRFFGWLGYTLSRSERLNQDTGAFDLYQYDQTHILTLVAGYNLPRNWDISARFRLVTGNPFTPVIGGNLDVDNDGYVRVFGPRNSERSAPFHQLDLRIDRRFIFETWMLGIYLDVSNVYWAKNEEGMRYNYDFTDQEPVSGLPFLPTLGISAKF
ncbi:MAG: TonB family protein [Bradymonadaceae bacterium]